MQFINLNILSQPYNWVIIWLIALFWLIMLVTLFPQTGAKPNAPSTW